jgi:hypothetical protein
VIAAEFKEAIEFGFDSDPSVPFLVVGPTGIGKSYIPEAIAMEKQAIYEAALRVEEGDRTEEQKAEVAKGPVGFAYLNFTACEFADLVGLPFKDGDKTVYCPPEWLKNIENFPRGVAVFDEVNRIELQTRQAYMQLLDRRQIGNFHLPKGWVIVQTANPADDGYHTSEFDKALVRRSCYLELQYDLETWQTWGLNEYKNPITGGHLNPRVLSLATRLTNKGLIQKVENKVKPIPTAAGMTICGQLIDAGIDRIHKSVRESIFAGLIGSEAAVMLEASLKSDKLKGLVERALRGDEIKGESQEVMTDLMFLFFDHIGKSPAKYGKPALTLWESLPSDAKPVLAKSCYPYFNKHKKEWGEFKAAWGKWCLDHMNIMKGMED